MLIVPALVLTPMATAIAGHDIGGRQRTFTFRKIAEQKQIGIAPVTSDNDVPGTNFGFDGHGDTTFRRG